MERETGLKQGGRRQEMGLERVGGRTRGREQRRMKRVRGKDLCSGPCKEAPAGVEMSYGGRCHPVPKGILAEEISLGIHLCQSTRSPVILSQDVSGRIFLRTGLFTSVLFSPLLDFIYLHNLNIKSP